MKKVYLIIGSNNFWYAQHTNKREAIAEAKEIANGDMTGFEDPETGHVPEQPEQCYVYEAYEVERVYGTSDEEE